MEGFFRNLFNPGQRRENRRNNNIGNDGTNRNGRNGRPNSTNSNNRSNNNSNNSNNTRRPPSARRSSSTPEPTTQRESGTQQSQPQPPSQPNPTVPPGFQGISMDELPMDVFQFIMQQAEAAGIRPGDGTTFHVHTNEADEPSSSTAPPPASTKSIRQLPIVSVTPQDLVDENNRECCICFEPHSIGDKVCRLPCAHIFHVHCIHAWLEKHCTCPICRYEIPTDNYAYEKGRKERMKGIKPRYAKYELERFSGRELKQLCERLNFKEGDWAGLDKMDVVRLILESGRIDVISAPDPVEYESIAMLRRMGVGKLKKAMKEAGVFFDPIHVVEKEDMVQIFVNSGRVVFGQEESDNSPIIREYEHTESKPSSFNSDSIPYRDWERNDSGEVKRARLDERFGQEGEQRIAEDTSVTTAGGVPDKEGTSSIEEGTIEDDFGHLDSSSLNTNMGSVSDPEEAMQVETDTTETPFASAASPDPEPPIVASASPNRTETQSSSNKSAWSTSSFATRSVGELRQLAAQFDVDLSGCIEKRDMIEKLVSALT